MEVKAEKFPFMANLFGTATPFGRILAVSLILHVLAALPFFLPRHGRFGAATVAYLDLDMEMGHPPRSLINPAKPAVTEKNEPPVPSPATPVTPLSALDKLQEHTQKSLDTATAQPAPIQEASLGLSITSGYFSSIGEGETLRDDIREYYFEMLRRINEKWWLNRESHLAVRKGAVIYLVIARNGAIVDRMLAESSGNPVCDRAMLHTLEAAGPLPPLPDTYRGDFFQAPLRFNMPLNLLESLKIG
jgi:protein TonB